MQFMADVHLVCEECKGNRFKQEILDVKFAKKKHLSNIRSYSFRSLYYFSKKTMKKKYQKRFNHYKMLV